MRRAVLSAALCLACLGLLTAVGTARAALYQPAGGRVYTGISGGDPVPYEQVTRAHAAVFQEFITWGGTYDWALSLAARNRSRAMLAFQTLSRWGQEVTTPGAIAAGGSDAWLLRMGAELAKRGQPVYLRPLAEMDAHWNPYCAYNANGSYRGAAHSTAAFRQAWRRMAIILRGGTLRSVDRQLRALRMRPLRMRSLRMPPHTTETVIPRAPVALMWVPQTRGAPDIPQNSPQAYWPGTRYVDWVGTDFYSKFPNFGWLSEFYDAFGGKPFVFGEWAMMGADNPSFVTELISWVRSHSRTRLLVYNQEYVPDGPLSIQRHPRAGRVLAAALHERIFQAFAPEWRGVAPGRATPRRRRRRRRRGH